MIYWGFMGINEGNMGNFGFHGFKECMKIIGISGD